MLEPPIPYELDEHDLDLIKPSQMTKIRSLFIKKEIPKLKEEENESIQVKPIRPEPLMHIDILEERKEKLISRKSEFSSPEIEKIEKEILNKLSRL